VTAVSTRLESEGAVVPAGFEERPQDGCAPAVVLGAWAAHVPATAVLPALGLGAESDEIVPAERAYQLLGRKGLLAKEPATRLALCAVHRALGRAPGAPRPDGPPDERTAVIACSNLGNADTVVAVARTVRDEGARAVSPLDAPNASSNVIASTVAIWFRFGGPNLMVCSGTTSGLDAIRLARLLLAAHRADRVVVVGAEADDYIVRALQAGRSRPVRAGAAALVLARAGESAGSAQMPEIGPVLATPPGPPPAAGHSRFWVGPRTVGGLCDPVHDVEAAVGHLGGALGVVQAAVAADIAVARSRRPLGGVSIVCGSTTDGWRHATVSTPRAMRRGDR
jgi:3-oxoacyl-[acyl-carrier-protein] synthase II